MAESDYDFAVRAQHQAAEPTATRLASANAGSGKTRVLVDRVSRILLTNVPPEKILCLTYTKAAAAEMQSRLFETLGKWSILDNDTLDEKLTGLVGRGDHGQSLTIARQLFAKALETPEGLKVQTIHAFCERILARFPIEAGILPGYEPIDEAEMRPLRDGIRDSIYKAASESPDGDLNKSIRILTSAKADQTLETLFKWMSGNVDKIHRWIKEGGINNLSEALGLENETRSVLEIKAQGWESAPRTSISRAANEMLGSPSKTDVGRAEYLFQSFEIEDPVQAFEHYASTFLTKKGEARGRLVTQKGGEFANQFFSNDPKDGYDSERERVLRLLELIKSVACLEMTQAFLTVATNFTERYQKAKHARRGLDFNDQIILVRDLLNRKEVSDWVRYKLDGGIEHILLDEAQDTSPEQWEIIDALAESFSQDHPDRNPRKPRTLFAVGDEKQSIYSFQGAEPEQFLEKIRHYAGTTEKGEVRMRMSFRSAPEILEVVDQIFVENKAIQRMFDAENYAPASDLIRHTAFRKDHGQVELWPAVEKPETEDEKEPWDTTPVDALSKADAREQLAHEIALQIKRWIDHKEPVFDRKLNVTRPITAGDILILVRQRNAFFDAVIRNLKSEGVAVAGADRLKLKDSIAVKDLLSLARFVLLPENDLALAEVLKSPLFGFSEEGLFHVAAKREGTSLWQELREKRADVSEQLSEMIKTSHRFAPYEFFMWVLDMTDSAGQSLLRRIYKRLGLEAKDSIEAFLSRALSHQRQGSPSLMHFVQSFSADEQELKRDMDNGSGEVRVMTVHGSKGLEAPVVFLPDTTQMPKTGEPVINLGKGFALTASSKLMPQALEKYNEAAKAKKGQEYLRLLYVALTRAESRLVICGYKHGAGAGRIDKESWYKSAQTAFETLSSREIETPFGTGLSFGAGAAPTQESIAKAAQTKGVLPKWVYQSAPKEGVMRRQVTPSHLLAPPPQNDMPVRSPLSLTEETRFMRGNLIHKLLEVLPEFEKDRRAEIAKKLLVDYKYLKGDAPQKIINEVFAVLDNPDFADIFSPESRAEISLAGTAKTLPSHLYLNAQIDRLSVTDSKVFIVDYKSNRPPPQTQDGVADIYWGQMAAYRELAREIYPTHKIVCALLWTDGPRLMILDDERLDMALTQIATLPT